MAPLFQRSLPGAPEASGEAPTAHSRAGQERFRKRLRASLGAQGSSQQDKGFAPLAGVWGGGQPTSNELGCFGTAGPGRVAANLVRTCGGLGRGLGRPAAVAVSASLEPCATRPH